jgi:hypothetical protein
MGWVDLITEVAQKAERELGGLGPFSAVEAATLVGSAFVGAESGYLLGFEKKGLPVRQSLRRVGDALRAAELRAERQAEHTTGRKAGKR